MIEFEIINTSESPPGGYWYTQPESGRTFHHYARGPFLDAIRDHRLANEYPISATWVQEIEDEMCKGNPGWLGRACRRVGDRHNPRQLSFAATLSFLQMLVGWFVRGAQLVDQEEANRRANACAGCPMNKELSFGCGLCMSSIYEALKKLIGDRKTDRDDVLGSCGICSCSLKAAVWFPLKAQQLNLTDEMKEEFSKLSWCWKR